MNELTRNPHTAGNLIRKLLAWYFGLALVALLVFNLSPEVTRFLPVGGTDALQFAQEDQSVKNIPNLPQIDFSESSSALDRISSARLVIIIFLAHILGTFLLMLPISWVYRAINYEQGYRKNFLHSLILIPICATTIVLLIQNNLALAFGVTALVAAVRFSVRLDDAMDGIYVFAAITVGLSSGVGFLGVALILSAVFCFTSTIMWIRDFGSNPVEEKRTSKKIAKLHEDEDLNEDLIDEIAEEAPEPPRSRPE